MELTGTIGDWDIFLGARCSLIHQWTAEGKTDEQLSYMLSCDAAQVARIREATNAIL